MSNQNTQINPAAGTGPRQSAIEHYLMRGLPSLRAICSRFVTPERLIRIALVARQKVPQLALCTSESLLLALMEAAELGLEPNTPLDHAALVPMRNGRTGQYEAEYWPMYKGLIELGSRSFGLRSARAVPIWNGDEYKIDEGLEHTIVHVPKLGNPNRGRLDQLVLVYAVAEMPDGTKSWDYMTRAEIDRVRERSRSANDGPWSTDYGQMAKKTVIRRLMNQLPLSPVARSFLVHDEIKTGDATVVPDPISADVARRGVDASADAPELETGSGTRRPAGEERVEYDPGYDPAYDERQDG